MIKTTKGCDRKQLRSGGGLLGGVEGCARGSHDGDDGFREPEGDLYSVKRFSVLKDFYIHT